MAFPFEATQFGDVSTDERLGIKAQALQDGMNNADEILSAFFENFNAANYPAESPPGIVLGIKAMCDLADQMVQLKSKDEQFQVLVGMVGGMGNGKSSILNALLDQPNLLPVGTAAATTAVACRVAWNRSNDPAQAYRAVIKFSTVEQIENDIREVQEAIRVREIIREEIKSEKDEDGRMEQISDADDQIKEGMEKIQAVWNIDEYQVARLTERQVLARNPKVTSLLDSGDISIAGYNLEQFASSLRPFLDSGAAQHLSGTGDKFAAWPLINEVRIFIKSPILRHGIVLVDLPGVGDVSSSRVKVTQDYLNKLDVTLVVSRITRAADEPTTYNLIDQYRECQMKLDGKFNNKGLGIVLSQTDGLDIKAFLSSIDKNDERYTVLKDAVFQLSKLGNDVLVLEKQTQAAKVALKRSKSEYKKATSAYKKLGTEEAKELKRNAQVTFKSDKKAIQAIRKKTNSLQKARIQARHKVTFMCTQMRSSSVRQRIQEDLKRRIEQKDSPIISAEDRVVDIMPVTVKGFWSDSYDQNQDWGITHPRMTGTPKLKQWIMQRASSRYEEHLDKMLRSLRRIYSQIKDWSNNTGNKDPVPYTVEQIVSLLDDIQETRHWEVKREFIRLDYEVQKKNPLSKSKKELLEVCTSTCYHDVKLWANKDAACREVGRCMHWQTYHAIICRGGGPYSTKKPPRYTYNWIEKLAVSFLEGVVSNWDQTLNKEIPELHKWIDDKIDSYLTQHMTTMTQEIAHAIKLNGRSIDYLDISSEFIPGVMAEVKDQVRAVLLDISKGAADEHPKLLEIIRNNFQPTFDRAKALKGKDSYAKKRKLITEHAQRKGRKLFNDAWAKMSRALEKRLKMLPVQLDVIQGQAMANIRNHILIQLWNMVIPKDMQGENGVFDQKVALQEQIEKRILIWDNAWRDPVIAPENRSTTEEEASIPANFEDIDPIVKAEDENAEDETDDTESDSDCD